MSNSKFGHYYTCGERLVDIFDEKGRTLKFDSNSLLEYENWSDTLEKKLREITGIGRIQSCELSPRVLEARQMDGYIREHVIIQTEPKVWMPLYVLIPDSCDAKKPNPCIIAPHGHGGGGKEATSGGKDADPQVKKAIASYNYDYGLKFAQNGYIVFCHDARGFGERREKNKQTKEYLLGSSCYELNNMAISLGGSLTGMMAWDIMRLIDYIQARDDCDSKRIGCAGLSGGGMQTLWAAALDKRIKCAVISGYFYGYKEALLMQPWNCSCNFVPRLWEYADMGDIASLIAPRPLLIETGDKDHLNGKSGIENVIKEIGILRRAYKLFDSDGKLVHYIFEGRHQWNGKKAIEFLKRWL